MAETIRYRCQKCGLQFEAITLDEKEKREAERERRPLMKIVCQRCQHWDVKRI
jgi:DNA-directed RNA polymerase subunit RPC12/RpoP